MDLARRHIISSDMYVVQYEIAVDTLGRQGADGIYDGLAYHPHRSPRWVPWDVFVQAQDRLRAQGVHGEVLKAAVIRNFRTERTMTALRMVGGIVDPFWVWSFFGKTILPFLLPIVRIRVVSEGPGRFELNCSIPASAAPCPDFFLSSTGSFKEITDLLGFGPAHVTANALSPREVRFSFETAPTRRVTVWGSRVLQRLGSLGARTTGLMNRRRELELTLAQTLRATAVATRLLALTNRRYDAAAAAVESERKTRRALNHAVRTPLNHVVAASSLLADVATDAPSIQRLLADIDVSAIELLAVVAAKPHRTPGPPADLPEHA